MLILACEKPLDNPEQTDQIYNDLLKDAKTSSALAETEKKSLEGIEKEIADLKPGDNSSKIKFRKKYESEHKIEAFTQKSTYFSLRAFKRKEYVLQVYPKYFTRHLAWPDHEEWVDYQASKRLELASRDWGPESAQAGQAY